jgi:hypothetical protein
MAYEEVKTFIGKMADTELFDALTPEEQDARIFTSSEFLAAVYGQRKLSDAALAFQVLYDLEAKTEHYQHLKRHGVTSFSSKGISVSFGNADNVAPEVIGFLGLPYSRGAGTGRLI